MNSFSNKTHSLLVGASFFFVSVILAFYSQPAKAIETNNPSFTISNFTLISTKRVSRTDFKYAYKVDITNTGPVATNVTAKVTSTSLSTSIVEDDLNFGDILSDTSMTSTDTFTIRQNRRVSFDPNSLVFNINAMIHHGLPPNPGEEGKHTIEGIDSDNDGVRDDVQIAITIKYPSNDKAKSALIQLAKALQKGFIKQSNDTPQQLDDVFAGIIKATSCISHFSSTPKEDVIFFEMIMNNTDERSDAYLEINAAASGRFFGGEFNPETDCEI